VLRRGVDKEMHVIFTHHAYERYRQFHMLDQPTATDEDARVILEAHGSIALRLPARTHRGDEVWAIHALGVELVVKRDGAFEEPVCVTVLPPGRFRGLTPLLAEQAEESARKAAERVAAAEQRLEAAKRAKGERIALAEQAAKVKKEKDKAGTSIVSQAAAHAAAAARKQAAVQASRDYEERIQQAKNEASSARNERDIILEALRVMRAQLTHELRTGKYKAALRIAVRHLRDLGATEVLISIAAVDPGLESEAFAYGAAGPLALGSDGSDGTASPRSTSGSERNASQPTLEGAGSAGSAGAASPPTSGNGEPTSLPTSGSDGASPPVSESAGVLVHDDSP
jgi:hypothetical protein